ncbi:MAG: FAD:protein FMN transferase [Gemmataceae bacterium]
MNRRDFLHPRRVAHTAGQILAGVDELQNTDNLLSDEPGEEIPNIALLRFSRRAMATIFEVILPFGTPAAQQLAEAALDEVDRLEDQLSVYRETSEVSRINASAAESATAVEERLFDLLQFSAALSESTEYAFDITAGALVKAWGFYKGPRRVPNETEIRRALFRVGMRYVVLDPPTRQVRYLRSGLEINLGSIGKGYALDRTAELLRTEGNILSALLHGGQSSVYALGTEPGSPRGWPVGIKHPWDPERRLAIVWLKDRGLATSAATFQHLEHQGRKLGHILDPRTGWPAEGMASATVIAPTSAEADALATAFYILGVDKARAYCAAHPDIGAVLLPENVEAPIILNLSPNDISFGDQRANSLQ